MDLVVLTQRIALTVSPCTVLIVQYEIIKCMTQSVKCEDLVLLPVICDSKKKAQTLEKL